jgi:hypothetical protein
MLGSHARRILILQRVARRRRLALYQTIRQASGHGSVVNGREQQLPAAQLEADGIAGAHDDRRFPEQP